MQQAGQNAGRWVVGVMIIFTLLGTGFGSWLSRLPAVRDHLGASTLQMSVLGFVLAIGSVIGLIFSSRTVTWLGPKRSLAVFITTQSLAMPVAGLLLWNGFLVPGTAMLAVFGFSFATADVAMNVSGASAERAVNKPRMSLFHAGYSLGTVTAMGVGALAEAAGVPVPLHLVAIYAIVFVVGALALRSLPAGDHVGDAVSSAPAAVPTTHTGPVAIVDPTIAAPTGPIDLAGGASGAAASGAGSETKAKYSAWRDPRIVVIGLITMSVGLAEGTAGDWLPLAVADGRGFTNDSAALVLAAFFVAMTVTRLLGGIMLPRFGRVTLLRAGAVLIGAGILLTILVPHPAASFAGAVLWGIGCAYGFPIGISAAADNPETAVRGVAAVSAIAYTAAIMGPMLIGFLGEHLGLLNAFWPLAGFAAFVFIAARVAREPGGAPGGSTGAAPAAGHA